MNVKAEEGQRQRQADRQTAIQTGKYIKWGDGDTGVSLYVVTSPGHQNKHMIRVRLLFFLYSCASLSLYGYVTSVSSLQTGRQRDASVGVFTKSGAICFCLLSLVGFLVFYMFSPMCRVHRVATFSLPVFFLRFCSSRSPLLPTPLPPKTKKNNPSGKTNARQFSLHIRWKKKTARRAYLSHT